jgi:hypothetical protein
MKELFLNFGIPVIMLAITFYFGSRAWEDNSKGYLSNDLSRDGLRWSYSEVIVAAYVAIWQQDSVHLDNNYQALINSTLKRSDRAVAEQMRRIRSAATPNNLASEFIQAIVFNIASMPKEDAQDVFEFAFEDLGGDLVTLNSLSV